MIYDVLGLGCTTVDDFLYVDCYPNADVKTRVLSSDRQPGGLTATALVAAARFGAQCAYGGRLGFDSLSQFVAEALAAEGIDLSHVVCREDASPIHSTIIVDMARHTRNIFFEILGETGADDLMPAESVIRSAKVLVVDHYGMVGNLRAVKIARAAGIPVVADFERNNVPHFDDLLSLVDHLVISRRFAATLTGCDTAAGAAAVLGKGRAVVVVTAGEDGCWFAEGGAVRHHPAFEVDVVDTTGCGNVFHGVYAAALAQGLPIEQGIRYASAAAAIKATQPGGQRGIPDREAIDSWLRYKS